jgi:hypothetical protein
VETASTPSWERRQVMLRCGVGSLIMFIFGRVIRVKKLIATVLMVFHRPVRNPKRKV